MLSGLITLKDRSRKIVSSRSSSPVGPLGAKRTMVLVSTSVPSLMILAEAAKESPRQHFGIAPRNSIKTLHAQVVKTFQSGD